MKACKRIQRADVVANVNVKNQDGDTALHLAVMQEHLEVATMLLNKGANSDAKNEDRDKPLDICKSAEIKSILLSHSSGNSDGSIASPIIWPDSPLRNKDAIGSARHQPSSSEEDNHIGVQLGSLKNKCVL